MRTASRLVSGSGDGPLVTAQLLSTPSASIRKSQCNRVASCFWTMKRPPPPTLPPPSTFFVPRLTELTLASHPGLHVGSCVPFYFCPRSVMLYLIYRRNAELAYQGGQAPIVHLVADVQAVVAWAQANGQRWAFSLSNAGSYYFEDRSDPAHLHEVNWSAVQTNQWSGSPTKEQKQAKFLIEQQFPWHLVEEIAVINQAVGQQARHAA